ncbi:unnamed protein product [Penicillium roqueforti FM164]|uniref:Genomic scaffold, ProqFM164S01 n=1 Tax=Penicillium roqueforti (strain FM164) TaxID=1365484 RepID=W6Q145_PENRF|nr:unnamed protein product [Penicillium roqueforti FM164]
MPRVHKADTWKFLRNLDSVGLNLNLNLKIVEYLQEHLTMVSLLIYQLFTPSY